MNRDAVLNMLQMQHRMNTRVHEHWIAQNFEWYRAAWIECGELMDHVGYKWWKKQTPDMEQVRLEVVDIWHFGLSALLTLRPTCRTSPKPSPRTLMLPQPTRVPGVGRGADTRRHGGLGSMHWRQRPFLSPCLLS